MVLNTEERISVLPLLPLRGLVVFPGTVLSFDVGRKKSSAALKAAMERDQLIFAVAQKEVYVEDPEEGDLYEVGCVVKVRQVLKISENAVRVLVEGLYRAKHGAVLSKSGFAVSEITEIKDKPIKNRPVYIESLIRRVRTQFEKYAEVYSNISPDVIMRIAEATDIGFLADFIASNVPGKLTAESAKRQRRQSTKTSANII